MFEVASDGECKVTDGNVRLNFLWCKMINRTHFEVMLADAECGFNRSESTIASQNFTGGSI